MRIVYNLRDQDWQTTKSLGILHVSTRILAGLAEHPAISQIDVLANASLAPALAALGNSSHIRLHFAATAAPRRWSRLLWDNWALTRATNRLSPDWLFLPKGFSPLLSRPRCRVTAFVHDTIFEYYRRNGVPPFPRGESSLFTAMLRRTAQMAEIVATNSAFTADEFRTRFAPHGRVVRIGAPIGNTTPQPGDRPQPPTSAFLLPTSAWPHKLTTQAIAWLQRWTTEHRFAGAVHGFGSLPASVAWPQAPGWVHHGRISQTVLDRLETSGSLLLYFSAYEGYGLPPVEALAAHRRTIASALPPLRETLPSELLFDNIVYDSFDQVLTRAIAAPSPAPLAVDTAPTTASRWVSALQAQP